MVAYYGAVTVLVQGFLVEPVARRMSVRRVLHRLLPDTQLASDSV